MRNVYAAQNIDVDNIVAKKLRSIARLGDNMAILASCRNGVKLKTPGGRGYDCSPMRNPAVRLRNMLRRSHEGHKVRKAA
jgi:hypothetical protein